MARLSCTIKGETDKIVIKCKVNEESYLNVCECMLLEQLSLFCRMKHCVVSVFFLT